MKSRIGDLTLGTARLGVMVRCIKVPDSTQWTKEDEQQKDFIVPIIGKTYHVRSSSSAGIHLTEIHNLKAITTFIFGHDIIDEPFFPFDCFNFVSPPATP